jgi:hypothetical protein
MSEKMTFKANKIANMTSKKMYMLRKVKTGFIMCVPYWAVGARCGSTMHSIKNASASMGSKNNIAKASKAAIMPIVSFGFSIMCVSYLPVI